MSTSTLKASNFVYTHFLIYIDTHTRKILASFGHTPFLTRKMTTDSGIRSLTYTIKKKIAGRLHVRVKSVRDFDVSTFDGIRSVN